MGFLSVIAFILMAVGGIAVLAGFIWFVVVAFRESLWWGIGCLVCGPVALFFLVRNWSDTWRPWVVQLGGSAVFYTGVLIIGATSSGSELPPERSGTVAFEEEFAEDYGDSAYEDNAYQDAVADDASYGEAADDSTSFDSDGLDADGGVGPEPSLPPSSLGSSSPRQPTAPPPTRLSGTVSRGSDEESIDLEYADEYIGQRLKLTKSNGKVVYCRLVEVTDESLVIQQALGGGHVNFTIDKSTIASLAKDDR